MGCENHLRLPLLIAANTMSSPFECHKKSRLVNVPRSALLPLIAVAIAGCLPSTASAQGAVGSLRRLLDSGRVPAERQGTIVEMICTRGEADDLAFVFKLVEKPDGLQPDVRRKVMELLAEAATTRKVKPSGDLSGLAKLIEGEAAAKDRRLKVAAVRLAAAWKLGEVESSLRSIAMDGRASEGLRQAALDGLVAIGGSGSRQTIEQLAKSGDSMRIRVLAAAALARLDVDAGAAVAAAVLANVGPQDDVGPLLDALLGRKDGADKLAAALQNKPLPADAAKMTLRYIYSVGRSDQTLSDVLSKAAGIALDAPPPSQEEVAQIAAQVAVQGDAARGEKIFRRADLSCMKCHAVSQAGGSVGPDLSAVGSISPADYVVNSILNPNLAIKEQYVTRRVLTTDGEIVTGIQVDRDDQKLRLKDAAGKVVVIPTDAIDQEGEGKSLMPQGLTKFLTQQELLDLARFISELGKPGPYAIRKSPGIQRWRVLKEPGAELTGEVPNVEILREHVLDTPSEAWTTAYAMVGGKLPLGEIARERPAVLYLQGEIDVTQAGMVAFDIACTEPAQAWLGAEPFESAKRIERELSAGKHTLTLRIELSAASAEPSLQVDVSKPAGSAAQVVAINGM
jgi:putative heme-binding domain-containing protein